MQTGQDQMFSMVYNCSLRDSIMCKMQNNGSNSNAYSNILSIHWSYKNFNFLKMEHIRSKTLFIGCIVLELLRFGLNPFNWS